MKFLSFSVGSEHSWGCIDPADSDMVLDLSSIAPSLRDYIEHPRRPTLTPDDLARAARLPIAAVTIDAPIPSPRRNIFAAGANYLDHVEESEHSTEAPAVPIYFTKATTTVRGPGLLTIDGRLTSQLDWEIELGVVLGNGGSALGETEASAAIFGYMVTNDVSARDLQHGRPEGQWFIGKSLDGSCPMGPFLVTPDELGPIDDLALELRIDGQIEQSATVASMIFPVTRLISELSRYVTLLPGDIILTGTPGGVGDARTPPVYLRDGQTMDASITGLGTLTTQVRITEGAR